MRAGAALGDLLSFAAVRPRRVALRNLAIAFPEKPERERRQILRRSCRNLGRIAAEFCHLREVTGGTLERWVRIEDPELWRRELRAASEHGAMILTAHFGNWELLAYAHGILGHPVTLIHRPMRNQLVDAFIDRIRSRAGTRAFAKHGAARAALKALQRREIVAIPSDQNQTRRWGVFVDFFGLPASTTPGPARLSLITGAPVIPAFLVRDGESDTHRLVILPPVEMARTADRDADVLENTRRCTKVIEEMIRRHPDHWVWFHKRWRTRPLGEEGVY